MEFLYAARSTFNMHSDADGSSWNKYLNWSGLTHLTEVVSLDGMLNEDLVVPDYNNAEDWNYIHTVGTNQTGFYTTLDFVLHRMKAVSGFNLLTVIVEPGQDCKDILPEGYGFVGYDLLDQDFIASALTNCGGFAETFMPAHLNSKGLIDSFEKAHEIKKHLRENNPEEHHADTNVIAVWRHKTIGR